MLEGLNHNNRFWKWVTGTLGTLLIGVVFAYVRGEIEQANFRAEVMQMLAEVQSEQTNMGKDVGENKQWIKDWSAVLKVPERDQRQDSAIEELTRRLLMLEGGR